MDTVTLDVQTRDMAKSAKEYRAESKVVAEFYGKGVESQHLVCDYETFRKMYRTAGGNTVVELNVDGGKPVKALVHDVQEDPVYGRYIHVDFKHVRMDVAITAHVPLHLEGEAPVVKEQGAILNQSLNEIEIKCLPGDLIHEIMVDVSSITDLHSAIHVSDITVSDKIEILTAPEVTIVNASMPKEEVEEEPVAAEEGAEGEAAEGGEANADAQEEGGEA